MGLGGGRSEGPDLQSLQITFDLAKGGRAGDGDEEDDDDFFFGIKYQE